MSQTSGPRKNKTKDSQEALVAKFLVLRDGFASQGGLINRNVDCLREMTICGDDISDLEGDRVSRDQVRRLNFMPSSTALDLGLGRKRVHKGLDGVPSVPFLVEFNNAVGQQGQGDTDELLLARWTSSTVRESDSDEGGSSITHESGFHMKLRNCHPHCKPDSP